MVTESPKKRKRYSDDERAAGLAALAASGHNLTRTSRDTGIPVSTLARWRRETDVGLQVAATQMEVPSLRARADAVLQKSVSVQGAALDITGAGLDLLGPRLADMTDHQLVGTVKISAEVAGGLMRASTPAGPDVVVDNRSVNLPDLAALSDEDLRRLVDASRAATPGPPVDGADVVSGDISGGGPTQKIEPPTQESG